MTERVEFNSCIGVLEPRCLTCPINLLIGNRLTTGDVIDFAVSDPNYSHLAQATASEIQGMAEQAAERVGNKTFTGIIAGALTQIATGRCTRVNSIKMKDSEVIHG